MQDTNPYKNSRELLFSHENLMRFSRENDFLMRIFEIWWEFFMRFFPHENFIFLMRSFFLMKIEKANETFPRSRETLYLTRGVFEKSSWGVSQAFLSASYIFTLPPFSNLIQIIILCSSPQAPSFPLSQSVTHTLMVSITTVDNCWQNICVSFASTHFSERNSLQYDEEENDTVVYENSVKKLIKVM